MGENIQNGKSNWNADDWELFLEKNPNKVIVFIGENYEIHSFEYDGQLTFLHGGSYGYDYEGSFAALEEFAEQDIDGFKIVDSQDEYKERRKLIGGEYDNISEWMNDE